MTKAELYKALDYVDATREKRSEMALVVLGNPTLIGSLLQIAQEDQEPAASRACWILESVANKDLEHFGPYLHIFFRTIPTAKKDSMVRPLAKICELLSVAYFNGDAIKIHNALSPEHLNVMVTVCFDWLIGDYKVAPKAYSMTTLFLLGKKFNWVHNELRLVLEQNYATGSAGYQARARKVLDQIRNR